MVTLPESQQRRKFLGRLVAAVQGAIGGTLTYLLGGAIVGPSLTQSRENWLVAGSLDDLSDGQPTPVTIRVVRQDGYAQSVDRDVVFLVKTGEGQVHAMSSTCTHLGCRVSWDKDAEQLKCPCHGGVYDKSGAVVSGPPPAPLARLATRIDGGQVFVQV